MFNPQGWIRRRSDLSRIPVRGHGSIRPGISRLNALPLAEVGIGRRHVPIVPGRVAEDERTELWPVLMSSMPYDGYQRRTTRAIPDFD